MTKQTAIAALYAIPKSPSSDDLDVAIGVLGCLANSGNEQAAVEYTAIKALRKALFPGGKKATRGRVGKRVRGEWNGVGKDPDEVQCLTCGLVGAPYMGGDKEVCYSCGRAVIQPSDCMGPCGKCGASGVVNLCGVKEPCSGCNGTGRRPIATGASIVGTPGDYPSVGVIRGDDVVGGVSVPQAHTGDHTTHDRGYAAGRLLGTLGDAERGWKANRRRNAGGGIADVVSVAESRAIGMMKRDGNSEKPRNQRKMGSGRDKNILTPGQQTRSRTEDRVRQIQADHNRKNKRPEGRNVWGSVMPEKEVDAALAALKKMGIKTGKIRKQLKTANVIVTEEDKLTAEAIRRGDLPKQNQEAA